MTDPASASVPERRNGFAPLGTYFATGEGRSVALIAQDGSVDWWAIPGIDSHPAFAAILDPEQGGAIELRPEEPFTVEREYVPRTNVVATVFSTATGRVRVTDSLNSGVAGRLPWTELARRIEGLHGEVSMRWRVAPGNELGTLAPWLDEHGILRLDDLQIGVRADDLGLRPADSAVEGQFVTSSGSRHLLGVVASLREPLPTPAADEIDNRLDRTIQAWQDWSDTFSWDGPWEEDVRRSALALKLLIFSPTGAIAAAATTSLPERLGGEKNWDYRYTWVRDTAYTLDAFIRCRMREEVHASLSWLLHSIESNGPALRPFYTLHGGLPEGSHHRDVPGYRHSRPVTQGNRAETQLQLGPYGDLFQVVLLVVREGYHLDQGTAQLLSNLADACCDDWQKPDAGIWELPEVRHFTLSKISCWQALDRAAQLYDRGELRGNGDRWRRESERVRAWVEDNCWSERRQAYTFYAGTDELDAGVLLGARYGYERGERMAATARAVLDELGSGPYVYRYSGMQKEEGAFLACTFWAVEALAFTDQLEQARALMDAALDATRHFGLLGEMVDPHTGEMLGNLPQALSHLALINAASAVDEASRQGPFATR